MAEGLFNQALVNYENKYFTARSAGLGALVGHPPDPNACNLMFEKKIDISGYRARQIDKAIIRDCDLILVMELHHKAMVEHLEPSSRGKVFRLGHWGDFDVPDPYQQHISVFATALTLIEKGVNDWLPKL